MKFLRAFGLVFCGIAESQLLICLFIYLVLVEDDDVFAETLLIPLSLLS